MTLTRRAGIGVLAVVAGVVGVLGLAIGAGLVVAGRRPRRREHASRRHRREHASRRRRRRRVVVRVLRGRRAEHPLRPAVGQVPAVPAASAYGTGVIAWRGQSSVNPAAPFVRTAISSQ